MLTGRATSENMPLIRSAADQLLDGLSRALVRRVERRACEESSSAALDTQEVGRAWHLLFASASASQVTVAALAQGDPVVPGVSIRLDALRLLTRAARAVGIAARQMAEQRAGTRGDGLVDCLDIVYGWDRAVVDCGELAQLDRASAAFARAA